MRQDFTLVMSVSRQESFATVEAMAARVHQLRTGRSIHLRHCILGRVMPPNGECVEIRVGEDRGDLVGFAFFPETRGWVWPQSRTRLADALHAQQPDLWRQMDADVVEMRGWRDEEAA